MKWESSLFDHIRIRRNAKENEHLAAGPRCEWEGCEQPGTHRAPKGRQREGEYFFFCLDHVREYNKSYNYFAGMADEDLSRYQKDAMHGHRPTWAMGARREATFQKARASMGQGFRDPFRLFREQQYHEASRRAERQARRRVYNAEARCLKTLHLDETATAEDIKSRYKELVKKHHPDANGGSRESEERLREIIQAYKHLKSVGLC